MLISRTRALLALPKPTRYARIRLGLKYRFHIYCAKAIYSTIGYWLNRTKSRYILEFRPDSHCDQKDFSGYNTLIKQWLAGNRHINCGDLGRFYMLSLNLQQILKDDIKGDFVELGVYKGNSAAVLAAYSRSHLRHVFLFDTFGSFDSRDLTGLDSKQPVQFEDTSINTVQKLVGTERVTYVQGFFPDSISGVTMPHNIAFAHIDCDLYQPTKAGLEWFYPRLSPGGMILVHDYSSGHWPGVTQAVDEFFMRLPEKPILMPDKSGTIIVRKAS